MSVPEQGQIVRARQRLYTVTDVRPSALRSTGGKPGYHLISLASVEDDALGETLQVVWENEVGTRVIERAELPTPTHFDPPDRLDAFLDSVRWGAVSQADRALLQAPFRSGISLEDYQLNPLVRAVQMPRVSLLIADDVGLGKTVEAGLVVQEMITRNRARSVLIICPSGLQFHWRDQMREKFGLEFRIVDSETMRQLRRTRGIHVNPWSHFPRLITSMDFIKRERPLRLFGEGVEGRPSYPRPYDILIIDEAHNVAPAGSGNYALDSQRTAAIRSLVPSFEHKLFLSATPHNGFPESFGALLELLDNQRFARGVPPDPMQLEAVMVRRLKRDLTDKWGQSAFQRRQITSLEVAYSDEERQVHGLLSDYTQLRQAHAIANGDHFATEFVLKLLKKRLLSSPEAFRSTLERHWNTLHEQSVVKEARRSRPADILARQIAQATEDYADDEEYERANTQAVDLASRTFTAPDAAELALLKQMRHWAQNATVLRDSKTQTLLRWLKDVVQPERTWNDERVIIFTEYRSTQTWLQKALVSAGLGGADRLALIYGGMDVEERERIKAAFQAAPGADNPLRILLATDAASEGIDLQNFCHRLVHFEIPWNPNRMEQRNGRIDRMGQKYAPEVFHFVPQGYSSVSDDLYAGVNVGDLDGDLEFLMRAVEKVEQMREDLMGKVGDVIASQVEEAMLGHRRRLDLTRVDESTRPARALLRMQRQLDEQIQRQITTFLDQRHELRLAPEHVQRVVEVALQLAGQPALQPASDRPGAYYLPALTGTWNKAREGLAHPFTHIERPIVFDQALATDDGVVLAHLNHSLVQLAQRLLRAEVWSPQVRLSRVTAQRVPDHLLSGPAVAAYARLVVIGGGRFRLHEELIQAGGLLTFGNRTTFRRLNVGELDAALKAAHGPMPSEAARSALTGAWSEIEPSVQDALEARMSAKVDTLRKSLEERAGKEAHDIADILNELARTIRAELGDEGPVQLMLPHFSDREREQYQQDMKALQSRLDRIPGDIEREQVSIRQRYADLQPRLFPVAVALLVPERMA